MGIKSKPVRFNFDDASVRPLAKSPPAQCPCCGQVVKLPTRQEQGTLFVDLSKEPLMTNLTPDPAAIQQERERLELIAQAEEAGHTFYRPKPGDFECDCGICRYCCSGTLPLPPLARRNLELLDLVQQQAEALAEREWVSVEERLPEDGRGVLFWHALARGIYVGWWCEESARWETGSFASSAECVTHWQALSKAPAQAGVK